MLVDRLLTIAYFGAEWVLYVLIGLSILTMALILRKIHILISYRIDKLDILNEKDPANLLRMLKKDIREIFERYATLDDDPATDQFSKDLRKFFMWGLTFLGSIGSNAPFIGLFGTVIGVINAFHVLAQKTTGNINNIGMVMSGISEALVATAVGLFVAIPAVISYNHLSKALNSLTEDYTSLFQYFRSIKKRGDCGGQSSQQ